MEAKQVTTESLNYYRNRQRPAAAPGPHVTTPKSNAATAMGAQ